MMEGGTMDIESAVQELIDVVRALCEKVAAIDEEVDKLGSAKIYDRLDGIEGEFGSMVGGLNDIIDGRRKREYTDGFRTKYPQFEKYEGMGKRMGLDIYGQAADQTYEMEDDEQREGAVQNMLSELSGKFDDLIEAIENRNAGGEKPMESEQGDKPEETTIEIEASGGVDPKIIDIARRFKQRAEGKGA